MGGTGEPASVLAESEVPDKCDWYVLGCREAARVTLYTQQVRALNLAWALRESGKISAGTRVVVVGAGAAGLTVAAALAHLEARVTVLEKEADPLPLQRNCYKRHLHPHIYDWPKRGSTKAQADLPMLAWRAGMARDVASAIERGFGELREHHAERLELLTRVQNLQLDVPSRGCVTFHRQAAIGRRTLSYDLLIFAIGFGIERSIWLGPAGSYWADDNLDQGGVFAPGAYLVSGSGDGGIIDVLRVALRNFRQDELAHVVERSKNFDALRDELVAMDADASRGAANEGGILFDRYSTLPGDLVESLDQHIEENLNPDARVTLHHRGSSPFSLGASSLHRLLLSRLYFRFSHVLEVRSGFSITERMFRRDGAKVVLTHGEEATFDRVIIRHGPTPSINAIPELVGLSARPRGTDREVLAYYARAFGPPSPSVWVGGATKRDYMQELHEVVSLVHGVDGSPVGLDAFKDVAFEVRERDLRDNDDPQRPDDVLLRDAENGATTTPSEVGRTRYETAPGQAILPFEHGLRGITLLVGKAGVGKSAFLKLLALRSLENYRQAEVTSRLLPVYVNRRPEFVRSREAVIEGLAAASLASLEVPAHTEAASDIRAALRSARAIVFVDNVDDWNPEDFEHLLEWLDSSGVRAVLTGRRMPVRSWRPVVVHAESELLGIVPSGAAPLLRGHFRQASAEEIAALLSRLRALPNRYEWLSSPFLLTRTAGLALRGSEDPFKQGVSRTTLYRALIETGLNRIDADRREVTRALLVSIAAEDVLGRTLRLTFPKERFTRPVRTDVLETGLVSGGVMLEFSHLSIAEYLASTHIDPNAERRALRVPGASDGWQHNLEVLAMAHSTNAVALAAALHDACTDDLGHRILVMLLRAIAYGGPEVETFCGARRDELVAEVARRLALPFARFGDDERTLMRALERAAPYLQGAIVSNLELPVVGEPGAEAWILRTLFHPTAGEPPPGSIYWSTIFCQARLLLSRGSPADVVVQTVGSDGVGRLIVLRALASIGAAPDEIRAFLHVRDSREREDVISALEKEVRLAPRFMGMFADDAERVRALALQAQDSVRTEWASEARCDVLLAMLRTDVSSLVKAAALDLLPHVGDKFGELPELLRSVTGERDRVSSHEMALVGALLTRLADEPSARAYIDEFLQSGRGWYCPPDALATLCRANEERTTILLTRLGSENPTEHEIEAAGKLELHSNLRALLDRFTGSPQHWHRIVATLRALPPNDNGSRAARNACLTPTFIPADDQHAVHKRRDVRGAAIRSFAGDAAAYETLKDFLGPGRDPEDNTIAVIETIGADPRVADQVWSLLEGGTSGERAAAIEALAEGGRDQRDALWRHFRNLPSKRFVDVGDANATQVRGWIVGAVAEDRSVQELVSLLADRDEYVRGPVAKVLLDRGEAREELVKVALEETDSGVQGILWARLAGDSRVRRHLEQRMREDRSDLRQAYYLLLSYDSDRVSELRSHFLSVRQRGGMHLGEMLQGLARDAECLPDLRKLLDHEHPNVRAWLYAALSSDPTLRIAMHDRLRGSEGVRSLIPSPWHTSQFERYFRDDAEAKAILTEELCAGRLTHQIHAIAPVLRGFEPAKPVLRMFVDDPRAREHARAALVDDPDVRRSLLDQLDDTDDHRRRGAAEALESVPEAQVALAGRIVDHLDTVRRIAYSAALRLPTAQRDLPGLMRAAEEEPDDLARRDLVQALARDQSPEIRALLQRRLARDRSGRVRVAAAEALGAALPGASLRDDPLVRRVLGGLGTDIELLAFLREPRPILQRDSPDLFERLLAWACGKLVSRMPDDVTRQRLHVDSRGGLLGDLAPDTHVEAVGATRLRLAGDVSMLARDRDILPAANTIWAWDALSFAVAQVPTSIVLACADAAMESLLFPDASEGDLFLGPTFFGFGLRCEARTCPPLT